MYRRSDRWLGNPFSAETLASGAISANCGRNEAYRAWVWNWPKSNLRENGRLPNAQQNTSELASTAIATPRCSCAGSLARPMIAVPITIGISGAEYCDVNEY